jgi:hypothetical protein
VPKPGEALPPPEGLVRRHQQLDVDVSKDVLSAASMPTPSLDVGRSSLGSEFSILRSFWRSAKQQSTTSAGERS